MARSKFVLSLLTFVLSQALAQAQGAAPHAQGKRLVVPGTTLALPADCKVKVRWVCPPLDPQVVEKAAWHQLCFTVDSTGGPWLGYQGSAIISPTRQLRFKLDRPYTSLACLDNGVFLVATEADFGFVVSPAKPQDYDKVPTGVFQPIANLPWPKSKLSGGVGNCSYFLAPSEDGGSDVYLLRPERSAIRGFTKVFTSKSEASAVTGDGNSTFIAMKGLIVKVAGPDNTVSKVSAYQGDYIRSMSYSPQAGLFYCTASGVGLVSAKGCQQFMAVPDAQICLRNGSLYVLLGKTLGVLALDGIEDLKRFDLAVKERPGVGIDKQVHRMIWGGM